jgi:SAM-dependent methyltransferase
MGRMRSAGALPKNEIGERRDGLNGPQAPDVESSSDAYARRFSGAIGAWFLERQAEGVRRLLAPLGQCRILEVGGGHAQLTGSFAAAGHAVTVQGSEPSCAARVRRLFPQVPFVESPLERLDFEDRSFDVVVTIRTMAHVENPASFLAECARVARRAILIDYPSTRSVNFFVDFLFDWKRSVEKDTRLYRTFADAEVGSLLASHGLRRAGVVRQYFWPMVLHRAHKSPSAGRALESGASALGLTRLFGSPVLALYRR